MFVLVVICICFSNAAIEGADPNAITENIKNGSERTGRSINKECSSFLSSKCLKIHVLSFIEELSSRDELNLLPGLSIVKDNQTNSSNAEEIAAELSRQFPGKPEEKLNRFLLYRVQDYLDGHSLKYKLLDPQTTKDAMDMTKGDQENVGRKSGGGGGLGGGKGGGGALLAAALMAKGKFNWVKSYGLAPKTFKYHINIMLFENYQPFFYTHIVMWLYFGQNNDEQWSSSA